MDNIESFKNYYNKKVDENYSSLEKFFNHNLNELCALDSIKREVLNCLMLGLYTSSITTTNHLLEKLLKTSLIEFETKGLNYSVIEKYTRVVEHAHSQYDHLKINKTLKHCLSKQLISQEQFQYLTIASKKFRDAYSHAETKIINEEMPNGFTGGLFDIADLMEKLKTGIHSNPKEIITIPGTSPSISQMLQDNSAKKNALEYFEKVYEIIKSVELNLKE